MERSVNSKYSISKFQKNGANLEITVKGSSEPPAQFEKIEMFNGSRKDFTHNVTASVLNGNERTYSIPFSPELSTNRSYRLEFTTKEVNAWVANNINNQNPLNESFNAEDNDYQITAVKMEATGDTPSTDFYNLILTFAKNLPSVASGNSLPFALKLSNINPGVAKQDFNYQSSSGKTAIFRSTNAQATFQLHSSPKDETFTLEVFKVKSNQGEGAVREYVYSACFRWTDSLGNVYRSGMSKSITLQIKGEIGEENASTASINSTCLNLTQKENVEIELFRRKYNSAEDPELRNPQNFTWQRVGFFENKKAEPKRSLVDEKQETELGQVLGDRFWDFEQQKSGNIAVVYKNRMYLARDNEIHYSDDFVEETIFGFHFRKDSLEKFSGKIKALAGLDNALAVFTENEAFLFYPESDRPVPIKALRRTRYRKF